jgi:hypothetical protein
MIAEGNNGGGYPGHSSAGTKLNPRARFEVLVAVAADRLGTFAQRIGTVRWLLRGRRGWRKEV